MRRTRRGGTGSRVPAPSLRRQEISSRSAARGPRLRAALLALLLALVGGLAAAAGRWSPDPRLELSRLRLAVGRAKHFLGGETAPEARRLEGLMDATATAVRVARERPWWRPEVEGPGVAWDRTVRESLLAVRREAAHRKSRERTWQALEPELRSALDRAGERWRTAGADRWAAEQLRRGEAGLVTSRAYATRGAFDRAIAEGEDVRLRVRELDARWLGIQERFRREELLRLWGGWVEETVAVSRRTGETVLVVDKLARRLEVFRSGRRVATFPVELGVRGLSAKLHAGDRATPEGRYRVVARKDGARTRFFKALLLDYPNPEDLARFRAGRRDGSIPTAVGVGSLIEIHGDGGRGRDWTDGCIALTNADMERLFEMTVNGTPVTIVGTWEEMR